MERKSFAKKSFIISDTGEPVGVRIAYSDGVTREYRLGEFGSNLVHMMASFACHGIEQRLGDVTSNKEVTSARAMREAADAIWQRACEGQWNAPRVGGLGDAREDIDMAVLDLDRDPTDFWALVEDRRKEFLKHPRVRAAIAAAKAARLAKELEGAGDLPEL